MRFLTNIKQIYLAAYVGPGTQHFVDIYFREIPHPRMFEWNYLHHDGYSHLCCYDIDGVLCEDPTDEENDDGDRYKNFILNASLRFKPFAPIGYLVSSRLEKYRNETEQWLKSNNIKYGHLFLMNVATAEERRRLGNHAIFKAEIYSKLPAILFVESDDNQAQVINELTHKDVFCVNSQKYYVYPHIKTHHEFVEQMERIKIETQSKVQNYEQILQLYETIEPSFSIFRRKQNLSQLIINLPTNILENLHLQSWYYDYWQLVFSKYKSKFDNSKILEIESNLLNSLRKLLLSSNDIKKKQLIILAMLLYSSPNEIKNFVDPSLWSPELRRDFQLLEQIAK